MSGKRKIPLAFQPLAGTLPGHVDRDGVALPGSERE
jgi:hypothetical protein